VYWIGEATFSEQKTTITNIVFYAQFFNTAFLILLVNANLSEHHPKWFTKYFKGSYYDYTPDWYLDVGLKIVQTMTISAFLPYINLAVSFTIPFLKRLWDSKFT
jgi:quinol-cytochrome oxidoreductase complex cytochrome b subunit